MKKEKKIPAFTENDLVSADMSKDTPPEIANKMLDNERHSSDIGAIISMIVFIFGIILLICGLTDKINIEINSQIINAKFVNCCPGVFVLFLSLLFFIFSRPKQKSH